jgi:tRNA threonylcarbamoyladenosine biosynthesis protein TsaB
LHESQLGLSPRGRPLHATGLLGEVERAADAAGGWDQVDLLAVGLGPGTFTGIRVGIATARGLCVSRGLPARGVCTLDALGRGIQEAGDGGLALAVLDGWRGEVFAALYGPDGERLWEPAVYSPDDLAGQVASLAETPAVAGSGAVRFRKELTRDGVRIADDADPVHRVAARHLCALAAATAGEEDGEQLAPIYLRPPDAERWRERDASQRAK